MALKALLATLVAGIFIMGTVVKAQYSRGVKPPELKDSRGVRVIMERMNNEDDVFLGQNNTFKTLITNDSEEDITLSKLQGAIFFEKGDQLKQVEEYALEPYRRDVEVKAHDTVELDYVTRLPSGAVLPPKDYEVEIAVWFTGPKRPEGDENASFEDRYSAAWKKQIPLRERHSVLDYELLGIGGMTAVGALLVAYVWAQCAPSGRVGVLVNGAIDARGKQKVVVAKAKTPKVGTQEDKDEWLAGTAAAPRSKSAGRSSRPKSRSKRD